MLGLERLRARRALRFVADRHRSERVPVDAPAPSLDRPGGIEARPSPTPTHPRRPSKATRSWRPRSPRSRPACGRIAGLPRGQQEAVALYYLAGLTQAEIAERLGKAPGAIKTRLHRARRSLRASLNELWKEAYAMPTDLLPMHVADLRRTSGADPDSIRNIVYLEDDAGLAPAADLDRPGRSDRAGGGARGRAAAAALDASAHGGAPAGGGRQCARGADRRADRLGVLRADHPDRRRRSRRPSERRTHTRGAARRADLRRRGGARPIRLAGRPRALGGRRPASVARTRARSRATLRNGSSARPQRFRDKGEAA